MKMVWIAGALSATLFFAVIGAVDAKQASTIGDQKTTPVVVISE
jgi:hypothetical protein